MNSSETCSAVPGAPMLNELSIFISYIFLLREPANLLSEHFLAVLMYRTVIVSPFVLSAATCLLDIIRCFVKVITDLFALIITVIKDLLALIIKVITDLLSMAMKITEAGIELCRSNLCNICHLSFHSISYIFCVMAGVWSLALA